MSRARVCKKHPRYKGVRKPRVRCLDCWSVYRSRHRYAVVVPAHSKSDAEGMKAMLKPYVQIYNHRVFVKEN